MKDITIVLTSILFGSTALVAQAAEVPLPDWAKLSISMACLSIVGWMVIVVQPKLFTAQLETNERIAKSHDEAIKSIMQAHSEDSRRVAEKLDHQTAAITAAICQHPLRNRSTT